MSRIEVTKLCVYSFSDSCFQTWEFEACESFVFATQYSSLKFKNQKNYEPMSIISLIKSDFRRLGFKFSYNEMPLFLSICISNPFLKFQGWLQMPYSY